MLCIWSHLWLCKGAIKPLPRHWKRLELHTLVEPSEAWFIWLSLITWFLGLESLQVHNEDSDVDKCGMIPYFIAFWLSRASQSSVLDISVPQKVTLQQYVSTQMLLSIQLDHSVYLPVHQAYKSGLCRISGLSCWSEKLMKFDLLWSIDFSYREFSSRYGPYGPSRIRYVWGKKIFSELDPMYWAGQSLLQVIELLRVGTVQLQVPWQRVLFSTASCNFFKHASKLPS